MGLILVSRYRFNCDTLTENNKRIIPCVIKELKLKECYTCKTAVETAYRIQTQKGKTWIFVCSKCLPKHQQGDYYRYGGTWKGYRHWLQWDRLFIFFIWRLSNLTPLGTLAENPSDFSLHQFVLISILRSPVPETPMEYTNYACTTRSEFL